MSQLVPLRDVPALAAQMCPGASFRRSAIFNAAAGRGGPTLQTWKVGRTRATTRAALLDYFATKAMPASGPRSPTPPSVRLREIREAQRRCAAAGI